MTGDGRNQSPVGGDETGDGRADTSYRRYETGDRLGRTGDK